LGIFGHKFQIFGLFLAILACFEPKNLPMRPAMGYIGIFRHKT